MNDVDDIDDIDDPLNQICFMQTEDLQPNLDNLRWKKTNEDT